MYLFFDAINILPVSIGGKACVEFEMGRTGSPDLRSADWRSQRRILVKDWISSPIQQSTGNITKFINFLASVRETFDLHATLQNLIPNVWVVAHFR